MHESDDTLLLDRIAAGDAAAVQPLLRRTGRVCDGWCSFAWTRVAARLDGSDVVQEAMLTASTNIQENAHSAQ